ncbi:MAG TPA: nitronate monooxygenase [Candidatus Angelobacter sp.]|nr:nitronate monooxygenase [Candidatus Angelobacter sp.]
MIRTRLTELLGLETPIISAPMGPNISGPELVAAVSGAGGLGILQAQLLSPELFREELRLVRKLTRSPFGVNFLLPFPCEHLLEICLEEKVGMISFFWGDPGPYIERIHAAGAKVIHQVGTVPEAVNAAKAGVDVIIAQGVEAGGHIAGEVSTFALLPRVLDQVRDVPVVAAGGIADWRGLAAALALGADGVAMGTRFIATPEANAHPTYKQKVVEASENDTVRTVLFGYGWPEAPHRVLRTKFVEEWLGKDPAASGAGDEIVGYASIGGQKIPLPRFAGIPPGKEAEGEIESMSLYMGQSAGLIHDIRPAAEIVKEMTALAEAQLKQRAQHA